jgi:hypothetical protein
MPLKILLNKFSSFCPLFLSKKKGQFRYSLFLCILQKQSDLHVLSVHITLFSVYPCRACPIGRRRKKRTFSGNMTSTMEPDSRRHSARQGAPQRRTQCTVVHHSTAGSPAVAAQRVQCSPIISREDWTQSRIHVPFR